MSTTAKFIRADDPTHEALQQLAKEHKLSNTKLLAAMVAYFRVTKADPQQPTAPDLTSSLAKLTAKLADLDKRTIGFIREQEKTYLKPILAEVQAHKVLNTPATSAPAELSEGQVQDMAQWFERVLSRGLLPVALTESFQTRAQQIGPAPAQKDPRLEPIKQALISVIREALAPEMLTPAMSVPPTQPA
jgi:formate dehydrogenase maturation protein FdhE